MPKGSPPGQGPVTVVVPLPPSFRGGTEEYAYRLVREFSLRAPTRVATTTVRWNPTSEPLDVGRAEVARLAAREVMQRPLLLGPFARQAMWTVSRQARVLNLHMPFPFVESPAIRAARRAGVPTVLTYHMDADLGSADGGPGSAAVTKLYRSLSAHPALDACDAVVSNSRGYAEASPVLSHHLAKVRVIPKGVDPVRLGIGRPENGRSFRAAPPPVAAVSEGQKRILFVGRLVPYKGVPVLLEACAQLRLSGTAFTLLIAGRGPDRNALEAQVRRLGIGEWVRFLGFVADPELGDLYRSADLVVVPSITSLESTATALEEAVACGAPVVGTSLPGTSENIPNDGIRGLLVPPGRADDLARAVTHMLEVPRPPLPATVRTWADVARDYLALFGELGAVIEIAASSPP